jgi:hypothetical protein
MILTGETEEVGKNLFVYPRVTLSTTYPTWNVPGANSDLRAEGKQLNV